MNDTVNERETGVVAAYAYMVASVYSGTVLFDKHVARKNKLSVGAFRAQTFTFAVAAVFGTADTFL